MNVLTDKKKAVYLRNIDIIYEMKRLGRCQRPERFEYPARFENVCQNG